VLLWAAFGVILLALVQGIRHAFIEKLNHGTPDLTPGHPIFDHLSPQLCKGSLISHVLLTAFMYTWRPNIVDF
jgi:hypothetical protein